MPVCFVTLRPIHICDLDVLMYWIISSSFAGGDLWFCWWDVWGWSEGLLWARLWVRYCAFCKCQEGYITCRFFLLLHVNRQRDNCTLSEVVTCTAVKADRRISFLLAFCFALDIHLRKLFSLIWWRSQKSETVRPDELNFASNAEICWLFLLGRREDSLTCSMICID